MAIEPDNKNWTWVLERQCPDCAFDAASVVPRDIGMNIRDVASQWEVILLHPGATKRPVENVWSPSEYGCHVRDVFRLFDFRLELMLTEDDPMFPNWDQDETAISDRYDLQDPLVVRRELAIAGDLLAERFDAQRADHCAGGFATGHQQLAHALLFDQRTGNRRQGRFNAFTDLLRAEL